MNVFQTEIDTKPARQTPKITPDEYTRITKNGVALYWLGRWKVRIIGFDYMGDENMVSIENADGQSEAMQIDQKNCLQWNGRKVSPGNWFH
jgi:hypothetical protein